MHLGTFYRGKNKEAPGTFDDTIEHLVSLGINAVEMMPIAEFAGGVSSGYDPAAPYAVESDYGGVYPGADAQVYGDEFGLTDATSIEGEEHPMEGRAFSGTTGVGSYDCLIFSPASQ